MIQKWYIYDSSHNIVEKCSTREEAEVALIVAATKFRAKHLEISSHDIKVCDVNPGEVNSNMMVHLLSKEKTGFWKNKDDYKGIFYATKSNFPALKVKRFENMDELNLFLADHFLTPSELKSGVVNVEKKDLFYLLYYWEK